MLEAGDLSAAAVIETPPRQAGGIAIGDLLASDRRLGKDGGRRLLLLLEVPENMPLDTLTEHERAALARALATHRPEGAP